MERELAKRRFGPPVRLEVSNNMSEHMLGLLLRELDVNPGDVVQVPGLLDLKALWQVYAVDRPAIKERPTCRPPRPHSPTGRARAFSPPCARAMSLFIIPTSRSRPACSDSSSRLPPTPTCWRSNRPLYRTSGDSPIVNALIEAADAGKQVVALVELKARFDEQANIKWARALEDAGVHVVYGMVGLKTHCKTCLVVRREGSTIRRYCHIGAGNYNPKTARLYEDVGLLTAAPDIGADLTDLFNSLTGYSRRSVTGTSWSLRTESGVACWTVSNAR